MSDGLDKLTGRERQTLRLVLGGYDAKSMARELDLSVHTINERLRCARRKLGVSSSREAARLLQATAQDASNLLVGKDLGEASAQHAVQANANGKPRPFPGWIIGGIAMLTSLAAATALIALAQANGSEQAQLAKDSPSDSSVSQAIEEAVLVSARQWLVLVDGGNWQESWAATGEQFQKLNTVEVWAEVSEIARPPLGAVLLRTAVSQEAIPAPPHGYQLIRFRTDFANRSGVTETVTLEREAGGWKVVGYWID